MFRAARDRIDLFRRDEDASQSVEAVLVIPLLLWAFLASYTFFDVYRAKSLSLKANYAISDLISREIEPMDMNFLLGAESLFEYLTQTAPDPWLRVTVIRCEADCATAGRDLTVDWSKATDSLPTYSNANVMTYLDPITPWIGINEQVIVVETSVDYEPPFSQNLTGIGARTFTDIVMTRPRFSQVCWEGEKPCV